MQINSNSSNREYLLKLAKHEIEPTLERLNELDWNLVGKTLPNSDEYVHLSDTQNILQQKADKIKEAAKAEAEKVASMNPVRRAFYQVVEKPVGNFFNKFKKPEQPIEFVEDIHASFWSGD